MFRGAAGGPPLSFSAAWIEAARKSRAGLTGAVRAGPSTVFRPRLNKRDLPKQLA